MPPVNETSHTLPSTPMSHMCLQPPAPPLQSLCSRQEGLSTVSVALSWSQTGQTGTMLLYWKSWVPEEIDPLREKTPDRLIQGCTSPLASRCKVQPFLHPGSGRILGALARPLPRRKSHKQSMNESRGTRSGLVPCVGVSSADWSSSP